MRPIELTFTGLRSYRSQTTIDFSNLDLFAVIGDTGAGKSTIIEALSLALYGTYTWTGGKLEELIADGATTMSIQLRFVADGHEWIVTRTRHRNASAPVNKLECGELEEKVDGNRAVNERLERLLGLTHDQFIRAVVMPQGRFDELLRARRTERNRILRSIFGLDDLRLTRDAAEALRDQWAPTRERAEAQRELLPADPAAQRAMAEQGLADAEKIATRLREAAGAADRHQRAIDRIGSHLRRIGDGLAAVPDDLGDPVTDLSGLATLAASITARRDAAEGDLVAVGARLQALDAERVATLAGFADRDHAVRVRATLASGAEALELAMGQLAAATEEASRLAGEAPPRTVPADLVTAAAEAGEQAAAASEQRRLAEQAVQDGRRAWRRLAETAATARIAQARTADAEATIAGLRRAAADSHTAATAASDAVTTAKVAHSDAVRADAAAAAAVGCQPGDPCPVCARDLPDGFTSPPSADIDAAAEALARAEERHDRARVASHQADAALQRAIDLVDQLTRTADDASRAVEEAALDASRLGVAIDASDEDAAVAALEAVAAEVRAADVAAASRAITARDELTAAEATLRAAHERHTELLEAAASAQRTARAAIAAQRGLAAGLPPRWRASADADGDALRAVVDRIDDCLAGLNRLDAARAGLEAARNQAEQRLHTIRLEQAELVNQPAALLLGSVRTYASRVNDVRTTLVDAMDGCELDGGPPPSLPRVPGAEGDLHAVVAPVVALLGAAGAVLHSAEAATRQLEMRRTADRDALGHLLAETGHDGLADLHSAAGAASAGLRNARDALDRAEQAAARAGELDAVLAVVRPFVANLDVLATTLRDQHFVGHLVSLREAELLAEATRRLKAITSGRYGFVPDFGVVNISSGEIRSPDSLSGGERFQAALALALALVEIASRGAGRLDAVFVDEGFGTLDAASLDVALDTLGTVAGGGKMVALISHLRPVAEYVDTVLHVTKDDLVGSRINLLSGEDREQLLADDVRSGLTA